VASDVSDSPAEVTGLVGRQREVAEVERLLGASRLLTLTGLDGIGKTRLALSAAARLRQIFVDGVWVVELSALHDPDLLPDAVGQTLGLADLTSRPQFEVLADHLQDRHLLLVLDGCGHLADACGVLAETLIPDAPRLRILATGPQALDVPGEHIWQVPPLSVDGVDGGDAGALFRALALEASSSSERGGTPAALEPAVARVCRLLGGVPLAIELAAAQAGPVPVEKLAEDLDGRIPEVAPSRAMEAAAEWAYELCAPAERRLWARLSIFPGDFDLAAAERVGADAAGDLPALVERSIVRRVGDRYRLPDPLRSYGAVRLELSGARDKVRLRHRDWFERLARQAEQDATGPGQAVSLRRLRQEHGNLRAALEFSLTTPGQALSAVRMAATLWTFWITHAYVGEGRHWLGRALSHPAPPSRDRARALLVAAALAMLENDAVATPLMAQGVGMARRFDDERGLAYATELAALVAFGADLGAARDLLEEAAELHRDTEFHHPLALITLPLLAGACCFTGDLDRALEVCAESRRRSEERGEQWCLSYTLVVLGLVRLRRGELSAAAEVTREALRIERVFDDFLGIAMAVDVLACCVVAEEPGHAARLLGAGRRMWREIGRPFFGSREFAEMRDDCERQARAALGPEAYETALQDGLGLGVDAVTEYALDGPEAPVVPEI
jgi:predicted ATPase